MYQQQPRRWGPVEWVVGLIFLGMAVQVAVSIIRSLIPYMLVGLVALGVGAFFFRRARSKW